MLTKCLSHISVTIAVDLAVLSFVNDLLCTGRRTGH
jgi:hypothetical protein